MLYQPSIVAVIAFATFVAVTLGLSFYLGAKAKSSQGFFAASGGIPWFVNGVAFAGDYLSAASFLGICGMIAFYGYDGFLYSIGYLTGWVVALFVIAEPLKRLGKFTFADALDSQFNSRGIKLSAAISTLAVSVFYLIPQMVGAGALMRPLLGFSHATGVLVVGGIVIVIVATAGMVSTTYVQFIKGGLLVLFCAVLTVMILNRGLSTNPNLVNEAEKEKNGVPKTLRRGAVAVERLPRPNTTPLPSDGAWKDKPYRRFRTPLGGTEVVRVEGGVATLCQTLTKMSDGKLLVDGLPLGDGPYEKQLAPVGNIETLPGGKTETGPLGPIEYLGVLQKSKIVVWASEKIVESDGAVTTVYYPRVREGKDLLFPGASPTFKGVRGETFVEKLDFLSLMLALFCGTASLPHILIRYYTVKDQAAARKSTVVGIASIGFFYVLTLYLGLGAMTSGNLDVTNSNMSAPLLARTFGEFPFALISAIAFTTVLGTVSGLIMAASGAVAHDLVANFFGVEMTDHQKVRIAKITAVFVGIVAMALGIVFEKMNVTFLVGWAFNVAASANLPALVMLLFWPRTTKQGITAAIFVGMTASLAWILLSAQAFRDVYGLPAEDALVPFSQPGIVTIPLGFLVLVVVSLMTPRTGREPGSASA
ncbi:MAG: cation acetate symporter [Pirellulales bacterium]